MELAVQLLMINKKEGETTQSLEESKPQWLLSQFERKWTQKSNNSRYYGSVFRGFNYIENKKELFSSGK